MTRDTPRAGPAAGNRSLVQATATAAGLIAVAGLFYAFDALHFLIWGIAAYGLWELVVLVRGAGLRAGERVAIGVVGALWIGAGAAGATGLVMLEDGRVLFAVFVAVCAAADTGAYFGGTAFGRHKMAPGISPGKTWEGFAFGAAAAIATGTASALLPAGIAVVDGAALGVVCAVLVPGGDLVESFAKRRLGAKDSGRLLPGHGGILDRIDGMLLAAPAAYLLLRFTA